MANNTIRCPLDCINNYVAHQVEIIATRILRSSLLAWEINFTESNVSSLLSWFHHFECLAIATMTWLTAMEYLCRKWPQICSTCRKHFLSSPHSWFLNGFVPRLTRRVQLVEQELLHFRSTWVNARFLMGSCYSIFSFMCMLFLLYFFFWPLCCSFSIYEFWSSLCYLQTFLNKKHFSKRRTISHIFHFFNIHLLFVYQTDMLWGWGYCPVSSISVIPRDH